MTYVTRATQFNHQQALSRSRGYSPIHEDAAHIHDRVVAELRQLGIPSWGLWRFDVHYLPGMIHDNEHIKAIVYGTGSEGASMLVATDRRVLYINKKPLYVKTDELTYDVIGGVSYSDIGVQATITLHSRVGDFKLRTFNLRLAQGFRDYIEERCLEHLGSSSEHIRHYGSHF